MSVVASVWPDEPSPGSGFAHDHARVPDVSTYTIVRVQLLAAIERLQGAATLGRSRSALESGAHFLLLRPALVLAAKAAWIVRPDETAARVARSVGLVRSDRLMGQRAMRFASEQGAPEAFAKVGDFFGRSANSLAENSPVPPSQVPRDETLIQELGTDVDRYYGTDQARSDVQILWNASSSLSHGERWFSALADGHRQAKVAETLTARSFDVVSSAINTTSLRVLWHVGTPPSAQ